MRTNHNVVLLFLVAVVLIQSAGAAESEFVPLFNGKDLKGWVNVNCAPSTWSVRNGMIFCTGQPIGELRTEKMYQNFIFEVEWRHLRPKGNAGVFVWADALPARGQPFHRAVEVQILDGREGRGHTSDGDIFPIHGATMVPINGRGGTRAFPTEKRARPSPEWNHYRIECIDGSIRLAVNGKVVTQGTDCSPRRGYICLESEGSPVEFRKLRIQELPGQELPPDQISEPDRGFVSLYDGVGLSGWTVHDGMVGHWQSNDWILAYDGEATGDIRDLWTESSFKDFQLIVDWRWPAPAKETTLRPIVLPSGDNAVDESGNLKQMEVPVADSGIFLRGSTKAQINLWQWPIGSGGLWGYRTDKTMPSDIRRRATPQVAADRPVQQWNRFLITMRDDVVTVVLNGKTVIDQCPLPGVPASGPIGLQHHGDPIDFSNIFVRKID